MAKPLGHGISTSKEIRTIALRLIAAGWVLRGGRHQRLLGPDGKTVITVPNTPSDHRAVMNFKADVRRVGAGQYVD